MPTNGEALELQQSLRTLREATLNVALDRNFKDQQPYQFQLEDQALKELIERVYSAQRVLSAELMLRERAARTRFEAMWPGFLTRLFGQQLDHVVLPVLGPSAEKKNLDVAVLGLEDFSVLSNGNYMGTLSTTVADGRIRVNREFRTEQGCSFFCER